MFNTELSYIFFSSFFFLRRSLLDTQVATQITLISTCQLRLIIGQIGAFSPLVQRISELEPKWKHWFRSLVER